MSAATNLDGKCFALTGPMRVADLSHTPIRGDLADIRLAGHYFVPHYAVPQPRQINGAGTVLLASPRTDAKEIAHLPSYTVFSVIDIAGDWAWGQAEGEQGPVGYVALAALDGAA